MLENYKTLLRPRALLNACEQLINNSGWKYKLRIRILTREIITNKVPFAFSLQRQKEHHIARSRTICLMCFVVTNHVTTRLSTIFLPPVLSLVLNRPRAENLPEDRNFDCTKCYFISEKTSVYSQIKVTLYCISAETTLCCSVELILKMLSGDEEPAPSTEAVASKVKQWLSWSWKYLWGIWFLMIVALIWTFRGPLRVRENISFGNSLIRIAIYLVLLAKLYTCRYLKVNQINSNHQQNWAVG